MILVFGPFASGKRTYVRHTFGFSEEAFAPATLDERPVVYDAQQLAASHADDLEALCRKLSEKSVVILTETGGGIVPLDPAERRAREAAGHLSILLAQEATKVVRVWYGLPQILRESRR